MGRYHGESQPAGWPAAVGEAWREAAKLTWSYDYPKLNEEKISDASYQRNKWREANVTIEKADVIESWRKAAGGWPMKIEEKPGLKWREEANENENNRREISENAAAPRAAAARAALRRAPRRRAALLSAILSKDERLWKALISNAMIMQ